MSALNMLALTDNVDAERENLVAPASSTRVQSATIAERAALNAGPAVALATSPERHGFWFGGPSKPPAAPDAVIAGNSLWTTGYELLDHAGKLVSWHEDVLDAFDAIRVHRGAAKVVRCSDRALIRIRQGKKKP